MTSVHRYEPLIDDAAHTRELDRQRFIVLRIPQPVSAVYEGIRKTIRARLGARPVSYPARAHVTLCGFAAGTSLDDVQDLTSRWSRSTVALEIETERMIAFPPPFQTVAVQVRKTPQLVSALSAIREGAEDRRMELSTPIPADDWIFHITVAYCAGLSSDEWTDMDRFVHTIAVPTARTVVPRVQIVAFDDGREYSGGVYSLG